MTNELVSCECAQLREKLAVAEAKIEALIALEAERQSDTERLLNVARGCHDYGGGYRDGRDPEIFHHGIQTVINALEAAAKNDPNDGQINVLERVGRAAIESTKESVNG